MDNSVAVNEPKITFEFNCRKNKQKGLINVLWNYSKLDIIQLASILNVSLQDLQDVHNGKKYLHDESAKNLALMFLLFFGE